MTPSLPLLATFSIVTGLLIAAPPSPGGIDIVEHAAADSPGGYWTPQRMAAALPIDLLGQVTDVTGLTGALQPGRPQHQRRATGETASARWTAGGQVVRATGRVFLTMNGSDFVCSASSVKSANRDLVVTAGHCVKDGTGSWAENWTFIPGYEAGREPYGSYPARRMFVAGPWSRSGDDSYDVGMVVVATRAGRHLADVVGEQEIGFNIPRGRPVHGFGYPADPPYDGERLMYCAGGTKPDPYQQTYDQGLRCDLTAGASGGPWLTGFDPATGKGVLTSVSSFKYSNDRTVMYGPYLGSAAKTLYQTAERA
ncbi:trypsin-like serine peptidase [Acrocarpospora catenulata]|uniref:trypsin-like serine peptidase n=1 Tax=Acrocarpospora catenulata TaxID=2836182 RepID=UPI001BDB4BA0|nr:hypothetical protein [Acrocarpospora catenulata]